MSYFCTSENKVRKTKKKQKKNAKKRMGMRRNRSDDLFNEGVVLQHFSSLHHSHDHCFQVHQTVVLKARLHLV